MIYRNVCAFLRRFYLYLSVITSERSDTGSKRQSNVSTAVHAGWAASKHRLDCKNIEGTSLIGHFLGIPRGDLGLYSDIYLIELNFNFKNIFIKSSF